MNGRRITSDHSDLVRASPSPALFQKRLANGKYRIEADGLYRQCSKCRDYWPADSEFFYKAKTRDGLFDWCKACYQEWRYPNGRSNEFSTEAIAA
jgi:hypothetical protein